MNTTGLARKIDKELDKMYRKAKKGAVESRNKTRANSTLNVGKFYLKFAHVFLKCSGRKKSDKGGQTANIPHLMQAYRKGNVAVVNALGNGVVLAYRVNTL